MASSLASTFIIGSLVAGLFDADFNDLLRVEERVIQVTLNSSPLTPGKKFFIVSLKVVRLGERGMRFTLLCG